MNGCGNFDHACTMRGYCVMKSCTEYKEAEQLAKMFHKIYEQLASDFNYLTRKETHVAWDSLPENNKRLMIATCSAIKRCVKHKQRRVGKQQIRARLDEYNFIAQMVSGVEKDGWYKRRLEYLNALLAAAHSEG